MKKNIKKIFLSIIIAFLLQGSFSFAFSSNTTSISNHIQHAHALTISEKLADPAGNNLSWVESLWNFSLSLINIALIGVLIFLGIVNILHLNYDTYEIKKFMVPLIVFVVLANFSMFISRAIIELSAALTNSLLSSDSIESINSGILKGLTLNSAESAIFWVEQLGGSGLADAGASIMGVAALIGYFLIGTILSLLTVLLFIFIGIIMYVREFIIYILVSVSPIALFLAVLPATQGLFRKWMDWFLRFVFMGPIIILVIKVAALIGNSSGTGDGGTGGIVVFAAVIGLLILAAYIPFIVGGPILNKAIDLGKKTGTWLGNNTAFGRGIKNSYDRIQGIRNQGFEQSGQRMADVAGGMYKWGQTLSVKEGKAYVKNERQARAKNEVLDKYKNLDESNAGYVAKNAKSSEDFQAIMQQIGKNGAFSEEMVKEINDVAIEKGFVKKDKDRNEFQNILQNAVNESNAKREKEGKNGVYNIDPEGIFQKGKSPISTTAGSSAYQMAQSHDLVEQSLKDNPVKLQQHNAKFVSEAQSWLESNKNKNDESTSKQRSSIVNALDKLSNGVASGDPRYNNLANNSFVKTGYQQFATTNVNTEKINQVLSNYSKGIADSIRLLGSNAINVYNSNGQVNEKNLGEIHNAQTILTKDPATMRTALKELEDKLGKDHSFLNNFNENSQNHSAFKTDYMNKIVNDKYNY